MVGEAMGQEKSVHGDVSILLAIFMAPKVKFFPIINESGIAEKKEI